MSDDTDKSLKQLERYKRDLAVYPGRLRDSNQWPYYKLVEKMEARLDRNFDGTWSIEIVILPDLPWIFIQKILETLSDRADIINGGMILRVSLNGIDDWSVVKHNIDPDGKLYTVGEYRTYSYAERLTNMILNNLQNKYSRYMRGYNPYLDDSIDCRNVVIEYIQEQKIIDELKSNYLNVCEIFGPDTEIDVYAADNSVTDNCAENFWIIDSMDMSRTD